MARPGWCGVGGEGAGGCGHALAAFKYSLNTKKMRARSVQWRGNAGQGGVGGGGGEGAGGCGHALAAFKYSLNIQGVGGCGVGTHWQPLNTL